MALPHLPAHNVEFQGIEFSMELGYQNIQQLGIYFINMLF